LPVERTMGIVLKTEECLQQKSVFMLNLNHCHKNRGIKTLCQIILSPRILTRNADNNEIIYIVTTNP
jgi:hypothetical protein